MQTSLARLETVHLPSCAWASMATVAPSGGQSKSTKQTQARAIDLFDKFRNSTPARLEQLPLPFDELSEDALCCQPTHGGYALYLIDEALIPAGVRNGGKHYAFGTVLDYMGSLLNQCSAKFRATASPATLQFLSCLDSKSTSDSARWWRGVKNYVVRTSFIRMRDTGEDMDKSAAPLTLPHVQAMCRALALEGSAAVRRLLCSHAACPRAPASVAMSTCGSCGSFGLSIPLCCSLLSARSQSRRHGRHLGVLRSRQACTGMQSAMMLSSGARSSRCLRRRFLK